LTLKCQAFVCCHKKSVDFDAFKAVNDSCLVFDGKLVIDTKFCTNDQHIRAAGPFTKYARRYHSENWSHSNFNSKEIGSKLAESVLGLFDPTLEGVAETPSSSVRETPTSTSTTPSSLVNGDEEKEKMLIPRYKDAVVELCKLPGGFTYFNVRRPAIFSTLESQKAQPDYGMDIVTGDNLKDEHQGFFKLHVNQYNEVQDITCLSKKKIAHTNLLCLYGLHEKYLNNLMQRHKEGLILDLYTYFEESWCMAIYHDRFKDFRSEIRDIFSTPDDAGAASLEAKIRKLTLEQGTPLPSEQRKHLEDIFTGTGCRETIRERLNSFLNYNKYHLPMFARPGML